MVGDVWVADDDGFFECIEGTWEGESNDGWWEYEEFEGYFEVIE